MNPASMRMVVDLPAPFGPRKPSTSPLANSERNRVHRGEAAKSLAQAIDLDQCRLVVAGHAVLPVLPRGGRR